jgi:hypothetical protein
MDIAAGRLGGILELSEQQVQSSQGTVGGGSSLGSVIANSASNAE